MKKNLLLTLGLAAVATFVGNAAESDPQFLWVHTMYETTGTSNGMGSDAIATTDDAVYTLTTFYTKGTDSSAAPVYMDNDIVGYGAPTTNSNGQCNMLLTKFTKSGAAEWHIYSNIGKYTYGDLATTSDGGVLIPVIASYGTNKNDTEHKVIFQIHNADGTDTAIADTYVDNTSLQLILVKVSAAGKVEWTKLIDTHTAMNAIKCYVATDADDNIYLAGYHIEAITFDADHVIAARQDVSKTDKHNPFLAKLDKNGNCLATFSATGEVNNTQFHAITIADGKIYVSGVVKNNSATDSIKLGDLTLASGSTLTCPFVARFDTDLKPEALTCLYATGMLNSKGEMTNTVQQTSISVAAGKLLVNGAVKGGFKNAESDETHIILTKGTPLEGYILQFNTDDLSLSKGLITGTSIEKFYSSTIINDYVYGISAATMAGAYLYRFDTAGNNEQYCLMTGSASQSSTFDGTKVFINSREKNKFKTLDGTELTVSVEKWAIAYAGFDLAANCSSVASIAKAADFRAYALKGAIRMVADKATDVAVYNVAGQLVKRVSVDGETTIAMPAGFYIVGGQKLIVR